MIAKTRDDVASVGINTLSVSSEKDSRGKNMKNPPKSVSDGTPSLGARRGVLTKKSTMNLLPKQKSDKVERVRTEGNEQVPNKFPVKELQPSTDDFIDGRDPEEKRKDEKREERLDRFYNLNKRARQGDHQKEVGMNHSNFSTASEPPSSLETISISSTTPYTSLSTSSASVSTPKRERGNSSSDQEEPSVGAAEPNQNMQLCPEIPPGLQVHHLLYFKFKIIQLKSHLVSGTA